MISTEEKLKESEERFRSLFKGSPVPTYAWQKVGDSFKLIDFNNAAEEITQGRVKNFLGSKASEMYKDRPYILEKLNRCAEEKINITHEMKYKMQSSKNEKDLIVKYVFVPPDLVLVHTEDITERKRVEEKIQYQAKLVEDVSDAIISTDLDFNIITWNKAAEDIYGWKAEETIGKSLNETVPVEYPYDEQEDVLNKFFEEGFWKGEVIQNHKDGTPINILASVSLIKDIKGNPKGAVAINREISERKMLEEELYYEKNLISTLLENHPDFIYIKDREARFQLVSKRFCDFFGRSKDDIIGKTDLELFPEEIAKQTYSEDLQVIKKGITLINHEESAKGTHVLTTKIPWVDKGGNIKGLFGISRDITERKLAEQKLKESEEKYRSLFNNMTAGFAYHKVIVDEYNKPIDYQYIEANPEFEKLTGLKIDELIGKKVTEILPGTENDPADWIGKFGNVGLTGIPINVVDYSEALDRWYKVSGYSPKKGYFAVTFADITEQKKIEQKLIESESKFRTIFEAIPDIYFLLSEDTTVLDYRGKNQELYVKPEEFVAKKLIDVLPTYLGEQILDLVKKTIIMKQPHSLEYDLPIQSKIHFYEARYFYLSKNRVSCFIRDITEKKQKDKDISDLAKFPSENPNPILRVNREKIIYINQAGKDLLDVTEGSKIPILLEEMTGKSFEDNTMRILEVEVDDAFYSFNIAPIQQEEYVNIYGQDITERKKSEIALNTEKKFTEDILNSSIDTIFVFDPETGKPYRWNRVFAEVSGYTDEEISKMKAPDRYYNEEDLKRASEASNEVLKEGTTTVEMSLITKNGKRIPYEYTGTTFKSSDGKIIIVSVGRDITERKETERRLKESEKKYHEAYDRANFYRDLFAHDINNILQVITSSAELISFQLEDSEKGKDIENIANIIRKHVQKGAKLVDNVRTLTELENGDQIIEPIELISVLKNSIKFIQIAYPERKVDINIDAFANMLSVQANELLQEIFDNILINAVKYNENSNVDIQIKITKEPNESKNLIKMEFFDNGIGIKDDKKEILFKERYRKIKGSKGMGLGLSLVSKIIKSLNGKIWVEDRVKGDYTKGSNFIIVLPE